MITIRQAQFPREHEDVISIFREYVNSATVSFDFQEYEAEFAALPGKYAMPEGRLLLARNDDAVVGCAALRRVDDTTCEMKRVYVRPHARGQNMGRQLVQAIVKEAKQAGYQRICLDVLAEFIAAQKLYQSMGFVPSTPVSFNPIAGTQFLALHLDRDAPWELQPN